MQNGIMLTTPGGVRFWHQCQDAKAGLKEMRAASFVYGKAWDDAATKIEFGQSDGKTFTASELIRGPKE